MSGLPFNLSRNVKASVAVAGQFANNDILLMVVYVEIGTGLSAMERGGSGDPPTGPLLQDNVCQLLKHCI